VAQLRMALERDGVPLEDLLRGAVILSEMGYRALCCEYAARVFREARDDGMKATARGVIAGAFMERGLA